MTECIDRRAVGALVLVGLVVLWLQILGFDDMRFDDAFISYRYGQNLGSGLGFVFNPGERIMGSTSPGQSLLAAAVFRLVGEAPLPTVMAALGCVAWTAQAVALFVLLAPAVGVWGSLFVAMCVAAGAAGSYQWVTLETNATMALVLVALALGLRSRWVAAAFVAALAGLMRPDAYLLTAVLGVLCFRESPAVCRRALLAWSAVTIPWFAFATWYFGTPVPRSAVTKFHRVATSVYAHHLVTYPPESVFGRSTALWVIGWVGAVVGVVVLTRREPRLATLAAYGLLHGAGYLYLRPFTAYAWHVYPEVVLFAVFSLGGMVVAGRLLARVLSPAGTVVVFAASIALFGARGYRAATDHRLSYWGQQRDAVYRRVAEHLREFSDPDDVVVAAEVGTIAYYSHRRMHDLGGLVTRDPDAPLPPPGAQLDSVIDTLPRARWFVLPPYWMKWRLPPSARVGVVESSDFRVYLVDLGPRRASP